MRIKSSNRHLIPLPTLCITAVFIALGQPKANAQILYVSEYLSNKIDSYNSSGVGSTFAASAGGNPAGLAIDSTGNLFLGSQGLGGLVEYTSGGHSTIANGFNVPWGIAVDVNDNAYVAQYSGSSIIKVALDGTKTTFATGVGQTVGITLDGLGNLYSAEQTNNRILKYAANGTSTVFVSGITNAQYLAFDSSGNLFASTGSSIYKITPGGSASVFASGLSRAEGIAFDNSGNLFASDFNAGNIYEYTSSGTRTTFATGLSGPWGLASAFSTSVPEPGSLVIFGGAVVAGSFVIIRRRQVRQR